MNQDHDVKNVHKVKNGKNFLRLTVSEYSLGLGQAIKSSQVAQSQYPRFKTQLTSTKAEFSLCKDDDKKVMIR
jgi:hypothetical protein